MPETAPGTDILIQLASNIVSSYVANHSVPAENIPDLIQSTYLALKAPMKEVEVPVRKEPAVPVSKSIDKNGEFIVCLEDGKKFKSMKRHLSTVYGLSPEEYRAKWDLPRDYPMVAPAYAQHRSALAKNMGLGKSNGAKAA
ncbi:MucR family transcriptional regulator [Pararhizobium sp. BT-229]|nr:MucR family transcriptional regulator [Pararhizobium sp. BT-229]